MRKLLKKLSDLKNAYRVLEIMDSCGGVDIKKVTRDGLDQYNYWEIKPKRYISQQEAIDLQKITLFNRNYYGNHHKIWKLFFHNIRDGYRYL